jgi:F-type H+-transporting ATPase subunit a
LHPKTKNQSVFRKMTNKIKPFRAYSIFATLFLVLLSTLTFAETNEPTHEVLHSDSTIVTEPHDEAHSEKAVDITSVAFEHILDSHSWHFWGEGHHSVAMPLPVIIYSNTKGLQIFSSSKFEHGHASYNGYSLVHEKIESDDPSESIVDLSITKNVAQMLLSVVVLFLLFTSIARSYQKHGVTSAPKGKQSFFEPLIVFVRDDIAKGNIGEKSEKFVPYLLSVFFLILINNVFGMIPIGANLTGNIAFTLTLSVFTLIITNINGKKTYWSHIFLPHAPKAIWPILIPIEIVGILTKPFALMIRLFANMTAGHIIIISLIGLIFVFKTLYIAPVSVAFALFIDVLECLVAFLQAYIFTMLTALFIGSAVEEHHGEETHAGADHH